MASIKISELQPTGLNLFSDSESYMKELSDGELVNIQGGNLALFTLLIEVYDHRGELYELGESIGEWLSDVSTFIDETMEVEDVNGYLMFGS